MLYLPARAHGTGQVDGPGIKQEFFGEGRFAGVRVGYDGKGAPTGHLPA